MKFLLDIFFLNNNNIQRMLKSYFSYHTPWYFYFEYNIEIKMSCIPQIILIVIFSLFMFLLVN